MGSLALRSVGVVKVRLWSIGTRDGLADLWIATVSNVLGGSKPVNDEWRDRVLRAAGEARNLTDQIGALRTALSRQALVLGPQAARVGRPGCMAGQPWDPWTATPARFATVCRSGFRSRLAMLGPSRVRKDALDILQHIAGASDLSEK